MEPKTTRARRTLPIPASVAYRLREHRAAQNRQRPASGSEWQDHGFVFAAELGSSLDACNVTHRFQRGLEAAGFPRQRFHDLRHACASFLLVQGLSPRVVMDSRAQSDRHYDGHLRARHARASTRGGRPDGRAPDGFTVTNESHCTWCWSEASGRDRNRCGPSRQSHERR